MRRATGLLSPVLDRRSALAGGPLHRLQLDFQAQKYVPNLAFAAPRRPLGRQTLGHLLQLTARRYYPIDLAAHWARLPKADAPPFPRVLLFQRLEARHLATPCLRLNRMARGRSQGLEAVWRRAQPSLGQIVLSPVVFQYRVGYPRTIATAHSVIPTPRSSANVRHRG